jgi:hypothetical protein
MKKLNFIGLLIVFAFVACDKDNDAPRYISVGSIEKTGNASTDFIVNLDNGKVLTPIQIFDNNNVADGDRVTVDYDIIEKKGTNDYDVNIYDIDDILTKGVLQLTEQNKDSIGNDPIHACDDDIWISDKHLNIVFDYFGYSKTHFINLVRPIGDTHNNDGRLILEFKHNANADYPSRLLRGIVSFELENLREADETSVDFVVKVTDYGDVKFEWEGSYTFESTTKNAQFKLKNSNMFDYKNIDIK